MSLNFPVSSLKGVGPQVEAKLRKLGISDIRDLLFHLPNRYQDRTRLVPIRDLVPGQYALIQGFVQKNWVAPGRQSRLIVQLEDNGARIQLVFFRFGSSHRKRFEAGALIRAFGEARLSGATLSMAHPETTVLSSEEDPVDTHLTPVYPTTEGLGQKVIARLIARAREFEISSKWIQDFIPKSTRNAYGLWALSDAISFIHTPSAADAMSELDAGKHPAQRRLAFEELLAMQLVRLKKRQSLQRLPACAFSECGPLNQRFIQALPFSLTTAQQRVLKEIYGDLARTEPMQRLVQGDVGSGKTVVAALASLPVLAAGAQVAVMAPTEILAEQHVLQFKQWLAPLGFTVTALLGNQSAADKRQVKAEIAEGISHCVIGTHALFQEDVHFRNLALAIIDEQHRFGVDQRFELTKKAKLGCSAHQLIMTATPIPRTLAMTVFADLDVSVIDTMPAGRKPIKTIALSEGRKLELIARISSVLSRDERVYWVCPLIEVSDQLEVEAAQAAYEFLKAQLPTANIALVHGRCRAEEKDATMQAFKAGEVDILVATTVIEVGVNVPEATLMVIENAERMGLSQLHQLRGRVGRGAWQSYCVLLYRGPLSDNAKQRLETLRESQDGFFIAQRDMEIRGPGEVLGTKQSGVAALRIADWQRDADLIPVVREVARKILAEAGAAADQITRRWYRQHAVYADV